MKRRDFLVAAAAAAWPGSVFAQSGGLPVIGFLGSETEEQWRQRTEAFRSGLMETGFVEGRTVAIEFRWAAGRNDRLSGLADDLVRHGVSLIAVLGSTASAVAAKKATSTIPIVVRLAVDPSSIGLVTNVARPGGNLTGWSTLGGQVGPKQVELLREILPAGTTVGVLANPTNPLLSDRVVVEVPNAALGAGFVPHVVKASTDAELEAAFDELAAKGARGLIIGADAYFNSRNERLADLAFRRSMAAVAPYREFAVAGGLLCYGGSITEASKQVGIYAGRILKGEKPGDLPVQQVSKLDLVLNMKTARAMGVNIPVSILARAEDVIE